MRIIQISPNIKPHTYNSTNSSHSSKNYDYKSSTAAQSNTGRYIIPAMSYSLSFKGFAEEKSFLGDAINVLKNSLDDVNIILHNKYEDNDSNNFLKVLKEVEKNPDLYAKITENAEIFDKLEAGFNLFDSTTLQSLDDVRYRSKQYTDFWAKNSKIGSQKTADIIKKAINKKDENVNTIIKNADLMEYDSIKSALIQTWFESAYNIIKEQKPASISKNLAKLSQTVSPQYAKTYLLNEKMSLCSEFNKKTKECILSPDTNAEQKLKAFKLILSYIQSKMLEDKGKALENDYEKVIKAQHILEYAKEKESLFYAKYGINLLQGLAFKKWEDDNLALALNEKLKKEIFYHKEEKSNKELTRFQNYRNFDTEAKYFVSRYYDACCKENDRYNFDDKDYVWQIINDRHNTKPAAQAIKELAIAVKEDENTYFEQLDNFYYLLSEKKINPEIKLPKRVVDTPNDRLSFADLYLEKLGRIKQFMRSSEDEKLAYLSNLTKEEMLLLNIELKKDWYKNDQKYSILARVNEQARNTSVFADMNSELKKININLDEIKIKTNEMVMSLKDAMENSAALKNQVDADSAIKLSAQISQMQREYNAMPEEQKKLVDENFSVIFPKIIDSFINNTTSNKNVPETLSTELLKISQMAKEQQPANKVLDITKSVLLSQCIRSGMLSSYTAGTDLLRQINDLSKVAKATNNLSWTNLGLNTVAEDSPFSEFFEIMPDIAPGSFIQQAGTGLAAGAGMLAAKGHLTGAATFAMSNPITAAALITLLVAGGTAAIGVHKAKKLEKSQRDLLFEVEI